MKIGNLHFRLWIDDKGLKQDATKAGQTAGVAAGDATGKGMTAGIKKAFKGGELKKGIIQGLGLGAGLGGLTAVTAGIGALTNAIGDSITAASDQREAMSLTGQVFEENTEQIEAWGETAAEEFGQAKTDAMNFASGFGTAFKNVGMDLDETTDKSMKLTELAADLGSAFNAGADEAALALRSGLLGESEPLRRFGVFLDEAKVKAKAVQLGIANLGDVLTDNQKVTARYALIMEQTADSQGMFGRDSESLADTQKALQAEMENVSAEIGEALLPAMVDLVKFVKNDVVPVLSDLADAMDETRDTAKDAENPFVALSDLLGDVFKKRTDDAKTGLGELNDTLTDMFSNLMDSIIFWDGFTHALDDVAAEERDLAVAMEGASETARETGRGIEFAGAMANSAKTPIKGVGTAAGTAGDKLGDMGTDATKAADKVEDSATRMKNAIQAYRDELIASAQGVITRAYEIIEDKAELTAINVEKADLRKILSTRKWTSEEKARYDELTQDQVQLVLDLAENGVISQQTVKTAIKQIETDLKTATGQRKVAMQKLLDTMKALEIQFNITRDAATRFNRTVGTTNSRYGPTPMAHGGHAEAGEPLIVGDAGRPELWVPDVSGTIIPSVPSNWRGSGGGGSGDTNVTLNLTGLPLVAESPADIVREMRRGLRMATAPKRRPPRSFG